MTTEHSVGQLHHYCSASTFLSIIQKRELWLTSLTQSNDTAEGYWMFACWLEEFNSGDRVKRAQRRGAKLAVDSTIGEVVALGTCFSESEDQLSQWRGYASDGAGFCITFDREDLENALPSPSRNGLHLTKVTYGFRDHHRRIDLYKSLSAAFSPDYLTYSESSDGFGEMSMRNAPEDQERKRDAVRKLFLFKNPAFEEEKEWRILLVDKVSRLDNAEFREARGVISPFVRLSIPPDTILRVTLGPTNRTPLRVIEALLEKNGIAASVDRSSASYLSR